MTDPIQHLRELMAKATLLPWTKECRGGRDICDCPSGFYLESEGSPFARALTEDDNAFVVAAVNLAPQLLEVAEKAQIYRKTMDEYREAVDSKTPMRAIPFVAAVAEAEKELDEALAALGGKGVDHG